MDLRNLKFGSMITALVLAVVLLVVATTQSVAAAGISTDEGEYIGGDTVVATGAGFTPGESLTVNLTGDAGTTDSAAVTVDGAGGFTYSYTLSAAATHESFVIDVVDASNTVLASTTFTVGSHGRYLSLDWVPGAGNNVIFTHNAAFRNGYRCRAAGGDSTIVACTGGPGGIGGPKVGPGDIFREDIGITSLSFGDSSGTGTLYYRTTSVDNANDWLFAVALEPGTNNPTIPHTYANTTVRTAFVGGCCRQGSIINFGSNYEVETIVQPGTGNSSPVTTVPVIVSVAQGGDQHWFISAADAEGDTLNWRLSLSGERGAGSQPTGLTIDAVDGKVHWDTTATVLGGLYWNNITIEELNADGTVKGKTAVDYLIQIVQSVGVPPAFDIGPTPDDAGGPTCAGTHAVSLGGSVGYTVQASDADAGDVVTLNAVGIPVGATHVPGLPTSGNPVSTIFSWTPIAAQIGVHVISYTATDANSQQVQCSQTITVTRQADTTPPECTIVGVVAGLLTVHVQDNDSGIVSIDVLSVKNANVVGAGAFAPTNALLVVTAQKIAAGDPSSLALRITDDEGNSVECDPVLAELNRSSSSPRYSTYDEIPQVDRYFTISNTGDSVVTYALVNVNGTWFVMPTLLPYEIKTIDIGSAMVPGDNNRVTVWGGGHGSQVMISDVMPSTANTFAYPTDLVY